jgi:hypothetical protein
VWEEGKAGWLEVDTVALCGGSAAGQYVWMVDGVDYATTWVELRTMWGRGQAGTLAALQDMEASLPFCLLGLDRCRSDKLSRLCSDKLIHPGSALGRGFLFPSSGRGGRVLAEGRSDAKENPRLTCSTLTCRLGKTGTYLSALAS